MKTLLAMLLLTPLALAQLPEAPQKTPAAFWVLTGAYTAGIVMDDWTTQRYQSFGCVETGSPFLYGKHPANGRFLAVSFALEAGEVLLARKAVRSHSKLWKSIGYGAMGFHTEVRWQAVANNLQLTRDSCR